MQFPCLQVSLGLFSGRRHLVQGPISLQIITVLSFCRIFSWIFISVSYYKSSMDLFSFASVNSFANLYVCSPKVFSSSKYFFGDLFSLFWSWVLPLSLSFLSLTSEKMLKGLSILHQNQIGQPFLSLSLSVLHGNWFAADGILVC